MRNLILLFLAMLIACHARGTAPPPAPPQPQPADGLEVTADCLSTETLEAYLLRARELRTIDRVAPELARLSGQAFAELHLCQSAGVSAALHAVTNTSSACFAVIRASLLAAALSPDARIQPACEVAGAYLFTELPRTIGDLDASEIARLAAIYRRVFDRACSASLASRESM